MIKEAIRQAHVSLKGMDVKNSRTIAAAARALLSRVENPTAFGETRQLQFTHLKKGLLHMRHHKLLKHHRNSAKLRLTTRGVYADQHKSRSKRDRRTGYRTTAQSV